MTRSKEKQARELSDQLDEALAHSFPASDPPALLLRNRDRTQVPEKVSDDEIFPRT